MSKYAEVGDLCKINRDWEYLPVILQAKSFERDEKNRIVFKNYCYLTGGKLSRHAHVSYIDKIIMSQSLDNRYIILYDSMFYVIDFATFICLEKVS